MTTGRSETGGLPAPAGDTHERLPGPAGDEKVGKAAAGDRSGTASTLSGAEKTGGTSMRSGAEKTGGTSMRTGTTGDTSMPSDKAGDTSNANGGGTATRTGKAGDARAAADTSKTSDAKAAGDTSTAPSDAKAAGTGEATGASTGTGDDQDGITEKATDAKAGTAKQPAGTETNATAADKGDATGQTTAAGKDGATGKATAAGKDDAAGTDTAPGKDGAADAEKKAGGGEEAKADPFAAFAPAPEPVPTRPRRMARAVGRLLIHEWTLATLGSLALAVLMTWPTLRYPRYTLPQDYWDPSLQAWQMAWSGHILLTNPAQLWQSNTFFPELWSFAFSDTLLGYAPAGMIGTGPEAAIVRYNIMFVLAHALATLGAYALARQLGSGRMGAAVAGVAYAYAPWLLAQAGHLHVLSNGGIPLALAMLARGHGWSLRHGYRPERRHDGWVYTGWLMAAWQLSLGFGIGLPFAYFLGATVVVTAVLWVVQRARLGAVRRPFGRRLVVANLVGGALFAGVGLLMAIPYFKVTELHPYAERSIGDIAMFSPPASGFVTAPAESRIWGGLHEGAREALPWSPEMTLLPGFVLYALAAGGLFFSVWKLRQRLLLLAGVLGTMALAMGTRFFGGTWTYVPLFEHLPGWNGLRTPGRLMLWTTLLLALLAAGAVTALTDRVRELAAQRVPSWPGPWLRLATLLPLLLVAVEGLNVTPHPVVPAQPAAMRVVDGPMLVLPSNQGVDQHVMLWSTTHFQDVVNGGSGFTPRQLDDVRRVAQTFPDQTSVDYLRTLGVRSVVLLRGQIAGTPWEMTVDMPVDSLGITREEIDGAVVYRL